MRKKAIIATLPLTKRNVVQAHKQLISTESIGKQVPQINSGLNASFKPKPSLAETGKLLKRRVRILPRESSNSNINQLKGEIAMGYRKPQHSLP